MALSVLRGGVTLIPQWGVGDRVFLELGASFFFLTRASEMFAASKKVMHAEHGLRCGDVAFSSRGSTAGWAVTNSRSCQIAFSVIHRYQRQKGTVLTWVREHPPRFSRPGGERRI